MCLHYPQCNSTWFTAHIQMFCASKWVSLSIQQHHYPFVWKQISSLIHQSIVFSSGEQDWWRDFKCKRKASWERGETKTVSVSPPRLYVLSFALCLDRNTFVVGEQALRSSSRASLHRWLSYSRSAGCSQPAPCERRQDVKKNQQIRTVPKLLRSYRIILSFLSLACLSHP